MSIQEEKQLLVLVQDLCARTPYSQIVNIETIEEDGEIKNLISKLIAISNTFIHFSDITDDDLDGIYDLDYCDVKPYLRPLSSMTEEEAKDIATLIGIKDIISINITERYIDVVKDDGFSRENITIWFNEIVSSIEIFDYLNEHHFDYRGLIPMGLALEAPEGMYK